MAACGDLRASYELVILLKPRRGGQNCGVTGMAEVAEVTERNGAGQKAWLQLISCALAAETGCLLISEGGSVTERDGERRKETEVRIGVLLDYKLRFSLEAETFK